MNTDVYQCPIDGCPWRHEAPAFFELPEGIAPQELAEQSTARNQQIQDAFILHFNDHPVVEWANEVSRLRQLLIEQPPLICRGCYVERHLQKQAGQPLRPQGLAQLIVDGNGMCPDHVQINDRPTMPGQTPSGFYLPGTPN